MSRVLVPRRRTCSGAGGIGCVVGGVGGGGGGSGGGGGRRRRRRRRRRANGGGGGADSGRSRRDGSQSTGSARWTHDVVAIDRRISAAPR